MSMDRSNWMSISAYRVLFTSSDGAGVQSLSVYHLVGIYAYLEETITDPVGRNRVRKCRLMPLVIIRGHLLG